MNTSDNITNTDLSLEEKKIFENKLQQIYEKTKLIKYSIIDKNDLFIFELSGFIKLDKNNIIIVNTTLQIKIKAYKFTSDKYKNFDQYLLNPFINPSNQKDDKYFTIEYINNIFNHNISLSNDIYNNLNNYILDKVLGYHDYTTFQNRYNTSKDNKLRYMSIIIYPEEYLFEKDFIIKDDDNINVIQQIITILKYYFNKLLLEDNVKLLLKYYNFDNNETINSLTKNNIEEEYNKSKEILNNNNTENELINKLNNTLKDIKEINKLIQNINEKKDIKEMNVINDFIKEMNDIL